MPQRLERGPRALDDLVARHAEVHRPEGDLLEDRAGHLRQLGRRVLEADADALAEPCIGQASTSSPSSVTPAADLAADGARRQPAGDQAQRRLARLRGADHADHLAVARARGRCRAATARVAPA